MALTKQELEDCRNYKRRLDMAQTTQGKVALRLAERHRKVKEASNTILKRCDVNTEKTWY